MRYLWALGISVNVLCLSIQPALAVEKPVREEKAVAALSEMGKYLRGLKQFEVMVNTNTDRVLDNGQLIQFAHTTRMLVDRPNHLQADISSLEPGASKHLYYDGKHFTLFSQPSNYYAVSDAPPTLEQLKEKLNNDFGIEMPLADLFTWGMDSSSQAKLTSAIYMGDENLNGKTCSHYAYREKDIDWQLWIQQGSTPVPCKLNIVTLSDKAHPQHTAMYDWKLTPTLSEKSFEFTPPAGSYPIVIKRLGAAAAK